MTEFADAIQDETIDPNDLDAVAKGVQTIVEESLERDTYEELLDCALTDEDKTAKRQRLETVDRELVRLDTEKKAAAKVYTNQIKPLAAERESILDALNAGTEKRQVEVYELFVKDGSGNIARVEVRRVDTDEVVEERAATAEEQRGVDEDRQPSLFDDRDSQPPPGAYDPADDSPVTPEDFEPTPEALAQAAEDEGRVVKTTAKEVKAKKAKREQAEQGAE